MAISPMFRERFQQALFDKLDSVHRHQTATATTTTITPINQTSSLHQQPEQQQMQQTQQQPTSDLVEQALAQDVFTDLHNWIH